MLQHQHGRTATFHPFWQSYSTLILAVNLHPSPGDHLTHPGGQLLSLLLVKLIINHQQPPYTLVVFQGERGEGRLEKGDGRRETRDREAGRQGERESGDREKEERETEGRRKTGRET